ncbi:transposase [Kamptonema sp. PCC 6506]|uniref:transposase n=1 Tax=Kamptonema sp. PCC 6506 TaxID=272129 RepID=UPI003B636193
MRRGLFSREIYRQRNIVERAINRLKQWRRIATRYEKLATNYTAMIMQFRCRTAYKYDWGLINVVEVRQ